MPIQRYTGDDNKEYYSADGGKTFNVIEKAKGDDGNIYEKLDGDWQLVASAPVPGNGGKGSPDPDFSDVSSGLPPYDREDSPLPPMRSDPTRLAMMKAAAGDQGFPADDYESYQEGYSIAPPKEGTGLTPVGSGVKMYSAMNVEERLAEHGMKPSGDRRKDLLNLEKAERRNAIIAKLATRGISGSPIANVPILGDEFGLAAGKGLANLSRVPFSAAEYAGALEQRIHTGLGVDKETLKYSLPTMVANQAAWVGKGIRDFENVVSKLYLPTAPETVTDPETGKVHATSRASRVLDPIAITHTVGEETAPMAVNLLTGGSLAIPLAIGRSAQGNMDDAADYFEQFGVGRKDAIAANAFSLGASSIAEGTVSGLIDKSVIGGMLEAPAKTVTGKVLRVFGAMGKEAFGETIESYISKGTQKLTYNKDLTWGQVTSQSIDEGLLSIWTAGAFGAGSQVRGGTTPTPTGGTTPTPTATPEVVIEGDTNNAVTNWIDELEGEIRSIQEEVDAIKLPKDPSKSRDPLVAAMVEERNSKLAKIEELKGTLLQEKRAAIIEKQGPEFIADIDNKIATLESEATALLEDATKIPAEKNKVGARKGDASAKIRSWVNAPGRLKTAQVYMLQGIIDGNVSPDQLPFIAAPLANTNAGLAADIMEVKEVLGQHENTPEAEVFGIPELKIEIAALEAEANLAALNGQDVNSFEDAVNKDIRIRAAQAIKSLSPVFVVDGNRYQAPEGELAVELYNAKQEAKAEQDAIRASDDPKPVKAKKHKKVGEKLAKKKREVAKKIEAQEAKPATDKQIDDDVVDAIYRHHDENMGTSSLTDVVIELQKKYDLKRIHESMIRVMRQERIELRPESGVGHVSLEEKAILPEVPPLTKGAPTEVYGKAALRPKEMAKKESENIGAKGMSRDDDTIPFDDRVDASKEETPTVSDAISDFKEEFSNPEKKAKRKRERQRGALGNQSNPANDELMRKARVVIKAIVAELSAKGRVAFDNFVAELKKRFGGGYGAFLVSIGGETKLRSAWTEVSDEIQRDESRALYGEDQGITEPGLQREVEGYDDQGGDEVSRVGGKDSPESGRLLDLVAAHFSDTGSYDILEYALENYGATVTVDRDIDGNEQVTAEWVESAGRNVIYQMTVTPNGPVYTHANTSDAFSDQFGDTLYIDYIKSAEGAVGVGKFGYRNLAITAMNKFPHLSVASGLIASSGSFLGRYRYASSTMNSGMDFMFTDIEDMVSMNFAPGWNRNMGELAWDAKEREKLELARNLVQVARGEQGIEYLSSGLNPFAAVDAILGALGRPTMRERLGINWETATVSDYWKALVKAIGGLGKGVRDTMAKIRNKWPDIHPSAAYKVAEFAHTFKDDTYEPELPDSMIDKNPVATANRVLGSISATDIMNAGLGAEEAASVAKAIASGNFYSEFKKIQIPAAFKRTKSYKETGLSKVDPRRMTWIGWAMNPDQMALRNMERFAQFDRALQRRVGDRVSFKRIFEGVAELVAQVEKNPEQNTILGTALALASLPRENGKIEPWTRESIKARFPSITNRTIDAYFKVRDAVTKMNNLKLGAIKMRNNALTARLKRLSMDPKVTPEERIAAADSIKELEESFNALKALMSNAEYWPLRRHGNFRWDVYGSDNKRIATFFTYQDGAEGRADAQSQLNFARTTNPGLDRVVGSGAFRWNIEQPDGNPVSMPRMDGETKNSGGMIFDTSTAAWILSATRISGQLGLSQDLGVLLGVSITNTYLENAMKAHELHRAGIPGWSPHAGEIFRDMVNAYANEFAATNSGLAIEDAMERLSQKGAGALYDPWLEAEAQKQARFEAAPPYSPVTNAVLTLGFIQNLGAVPAFALVNSLQQVVMNLRYFGKFYGYAESSKAIALSNLIAPQFVQWLSINDFSGMSAEDLNRIVSDKIDSIVSKTALRVFAGDKYNEVVNAVKIALSSAMVTGVTAPNLADMLTSNARTSTAGKVGKVANMVVEVLGYLAAKTERENLTAGIIQAAMLGAKHGFINTHAGGWSLEHISENDPVIEGREWRADIAYRSALPTRNVNFVRRRGSIPPYMRVKGSVARAVTLPALLFKGFIVGMVTLTHNLGVVDARNKPNTAGKIGAYAKTQLADLAIVTLLAGPTAWWGLGLVSFVIKSMFGEREWYEFWNTFKEYAVDRIKEAMPGETEDAKKENATRMMFNVENGVLPNMVGVNLHNSLAANLFMAPSDSTPVEDFAYALGGAPYGRAFKTANALWRDKKPLGEALREMNPRAISNLERAINGKMNYMGSPAQDYTRMDRVLKALSFNPTNEAISQDKQTQIFSVINDRKDKVKELTSLAKSIIRKNRDKDISEVARLVSDKVIPEIIKYNEGLKYWMERNPGTIRPIEANEVMKAVRNEARSQAKIKDMLSGEGASDGE